MKLFSAKVRIMGQVQDEVSKANVTQAEIALLKSIHGDDAVGDIKPTETVERTEAEERERLEMIYGDAIVGRLFGAPIARIGDDAPAPTRPLPGARKAAAIELEDVA